MNEQLKDHRLVKPDDQVWLRSIGIFQMIGGGLGFIIFAIFLIFPSGPFAILVLPGLLLFVLSIYAGLQCYQLKENCIKLTMINQAFQIVSFSAGIFSFQYVSGFSFSPSISIGKIFNIGFHLNLSSFKFNLDTNNENYYLEVNIIALAVIYKIRQISSNLKVRLWRLEIEKKQNL